MGPNTAFDRPEEAALDGWPEGARATVVSVAGNGPCLGWDDPAKIHWSL